MVAELSTALLSEKKNTELVIYFHLKRREICLSQRYYLYANVSRIIVPRSNKT